MMVGILISGAVFMSLAMGFAWVLQYRLRNAGWVDVVWSFGSGLLGLFWSLAPGPPGPRQWAIAGLVALWSIRLGGALARRVARGAEDPRYAGLRETWGKRFQSRLFWFLQVQAAAAILLALSILLAAHNPAPGLRPADLAGLAVLGVAILGEGLADRQLRRFRRDPARAGAVCDIGLWAWSRHPNYFFQWFGWLAYPLLAIDPGGSYPWGWAALLGPALMYLVLVHGSGIPPLEQHMLRSRGPAFRAYQERTSAFLPWPPRRRASSEIP